jgi:hypothetical protein
MIENVLHKTETRKENKLPIKYFASEEALKQALKMK